MKYCPNPECPHFESTGSPAEFLDEIRDCSDCGTRLINGEASDFKKQEPLPATPSVIIGWFREPSLAYLAKTKLEAEGITAFLFDEHLVNIQWLYSEAIGRVKLAVPKPEADEALKIITENNSDLLIEADASIIPPRDSNNCPKCKSEAIVLKKASRKAAAFSLLLGFPFIFFKKRYQCQQCGYEWK